MKKLFSFLLVFLLFLSGCNEKHDFATDLVEEEQTELKDAILSDLKSDEIFIAFVQEALDFTLFLTDAIEQSPLDFDSFLEKIKSIEDEFPKDHESQFIEIGKLFKDGIFEERFRSNMERISYFNSELNLRYGDGVYDFAEDAIVDLIDDGIISFSSCNWKYNLCIAGAVAGGILCHGGCTGGTAGFGAPVCVAICLTIQAAASTLCWDTYCS